MTDEQAIDVLLAIKACFPNGDRNVDERAALARQAIWRNAIRKWHYGPAMEAVEAVALSCRYAYPSLAELHAAYSDANRPRPDLVGVANALPAPGHTTASPEEIRSACAAAIATVEANAVVPPLRVPRERADQDRIERELASRKGIATPPVRDGKAAATGDGS